MNAVPAPLVPVILGLAALACFLAWVKFARRGGTAPTTGTSAGTGAPAASDAADIAAPVAAADAPRAPESGYRRALIEAGIMDIRRQAGFTALHVASTLGGVLGGLWVAAGGEATNVALGILASIGGWLGWWLPRSWLQGQRTQRRIAMMTEFPIALDLLQIALEGGMGLHAAWAAVATNLSGMRGGLSQEMFQVEVEVGFGASWGTALSAATDRTGLPEFRALGSLLEQTERFGTEMAQMIHVMSDSLRHDEVQALEERAHRASALLLLPLAGLLLPATLILMFAPTFALLIEGMSKAVP
jgi:tight adherence protein C